jgi:kumamolisin
MPDDRVRLEESHREPVAGARRIGPADPDEHIDVTVVLRPRAAIKPGERVSRDEFARKYGADPADIQLVEKFAAAHRLQVIDQSPARRSVVLSGTVADMQQAFGVELGTYEHPAGGTYRGRVGEVQLPPELAEPVKGVFGLDNRPQAHPHMRIAGDAVDGGAADEPLAARGTFSPPQVAQLYDYPTDLDGSGQCIAIIELGGGFRQSDISAYFRSLGLNPPVVTAVSVDHGKNRPTNPNSADGEVMLDIEVAGSVAPGAHLVVYFTNNTSQGFLDAITTATHDTTNNPSIMSISWGGPEDSWTAQAMTQMDQAFQDAGKLGMTVFVAAGDSGSSDGQLDGQQHVDFPASSPNVTACGGTHLVGSASTITGEVVWETSPPPQPEGTGGGVSAVFAVPDYQTAAGLNPTSVNDGTAGRGVPDVAGDADPATGYVTRVDGRTMVVGGTSAVAPLWSGLTALINQSIVAGGGTTVGFINPALYELGDASGAFHDITQGNNGAYQAGPGWDACTGWGSPDGSVLLANLQT